MTSESVDFFDINGFTHFNKYRAERRGGGVSIYVRNNLSPKHVPEISVPRDIEVVWCHIRPKRLPREVSSIYIASVYCPPNCGIEPDLTDHLITSVDTIRTQHPDAGFVMLGDFNQLDTDTICQNISLQQIIKAPTRNNALLDKIMTNLMRFYRNAEITSPLGLSDHNVILWYPQLSSLLHRNVVHTRVVRPMRDSDIRAFGQWISSQTWSEVSDAGETAGKCDAFYAALHSAIDQFFPTKQVKTHQNDKPWVTPVLKAMIKQRQSLFKSGSKYQWKACSNKVIRTIAREKQRFYHDRVHNLKHEDPKSWYRNIRIMTNGSRQSPNIDVPNIDQSETLQIAQAINKQFVQVASDIPPLNRNNLPAYLPARGPPPSVQPWEVMRQLERVKVGKSAGPDEVPAPSHYM
ncbi:uncharacterized protein [Diadema setosum]|uniref:uncharacterized protein n=1 Tax=Diadema setosum TaxID=31175 RepID=UPI003B3ADEFC